MKRKFGLVSLIAVFLLSFIIASHGESYELNESVTAKAVIAVKWYGVGKRALEGLAGIKKVETGWHGIFEVNRIYYDPSKITIDEMVKVLKKAKTFIKVIRIR